MESRSLSSWSYEIIMDPIQKEPWNFNANGTPKNYGGGKERMKCPQSEPTDEYGTAKEVANALFYYDKKIDEPDCFITNSIAMLVIIQKGLSDESAVNLGIKKPENKYVNGKHEIGSPLAIANLVHHYLDWLRASSKRTWDSRGLNPKRQMLNVCFKGMYVNSSTLLHYHENPKRH